VKEENPSLRTSPVLESGGSPEKLSKTIELFHHAYE
jgi:hypothetical protein